GYGAFGIVFEAHNVFDHRKYAFKRISVEPNEKQIERALREFETMSPLDHPGIVKCSGAWVENPPMEWQMMSDIATSARFPSSGMTV
ncbi:hypothetical protein PMAYCL1PPCAC_08490, partial [Pristionchus mayeri]